MKKLGMLGIIGGAAILTAVPLSLQWSQKNVTLSLASAEAQERLTATSVAGVSRRAYRRAYRSAAYASAAGYGHGLYSGYGYPASMVNMVPMLCATIWRRPTAGLVRPLPIDGAA